jgi:hypothetical protein
VVKTFIQRCLIKDQRKRSSAQDLLSDPLLELTEHVRRVSNVATPRSSDGGFPSSVPVKAANNKPKKKVSISQGDNDVSKASRKLTSLFPSVVNDPDAEHKKKRAQERWQKVRKIVFESPEQLLVGKMPQFQQDMNAFAIPREDLKLSSRPFAVGGGGQIFKGVYNRCTVAAKAIFSQVRERESLHIGC